jgi:ureidoacrylate peracid hydrolase
MPVMWSRQEHTSFDVTRPRHQVKTHLAKLEYIPCLRGTWDAELLDDLASLVEDGDLVFPKHRASGFYNTNLELELRMRGIDTLIITGVSSNYCVDATIRDAYARDFDLYIVEDACACPWPDLHDATMKTAAIFHGEVVSTADMLAALETLDRERAPV